MDILFWVHLLFILFVISIPFWKISYLRYGVYVPILLATIWIIYSGCPLTKMQQGISDDYFSRVLLQYIIPDISKEATTRFTYYVLLVVTWIGLYRLCRSA